MENVQALFVCRFVERIWILPNGSIEEDGVLRDECETRSEVIQSDCADIDVVDGDLSLAKLCESEERGRHRALSRPCSAHDADLFPWEDLKADAAEDRVQRWVIAEHDVLEANASFV